MNPICVLVLRGRVKQTPIKFEEPSQGKVNPGQNVFRSTRLNDESQFGWADQGKRILYVFLVSRGWAKRTLIKFEKLGRGKANPGQNLFGFTRLSDGVILVEQTKGNESYMYVGVQRLSETNPLSFWEARLMESKPRLIFFCSRRLREARQILILAACGWVKRILS